MLFKLFCTDGRHKEAEHNTNGIKPHSNPIRLTHILTPSCLLHTLADAAGVSHAATEGHADVHGVRGGVRQVLCAAVHGPAAHRLGGLGPRGGPLVGPRAGCCLHFARGRADLTFFNDFYFIHF